MSFAGKDPAVELLVDEPPADKTSGGEDPAAKWLADEPLAEKTSGGEESAAMPFAEVTSAANNLLVDC